MRRLNTKFLARLLFLVGCALLLGLGLAKEKHVIHPLTTQGSTTLRGGAEFIADTTIDRYMLRDGQLVDVYSLSGSILGIKDCKT